MNIQSISIVVPTNGCINCCKFCVSRMHTNNYTRYFDPFHIQKRIDWAIMNGVNTCIFTGTGEVLQNKPFLKKIAYLFQKMDYPFPNTEVQTTGVMLDKETYSLFRNMGVNTISLSISNPFDDENNMEIIGVPENLKFSLREITNDIKENGFNVRYSLNLTKIYDQTPATLLFGRLKRLNPDQLTFRKLWDNGNESLEQTIWVKENKCSEATYNMIFDHIANNGKPLYRLPFGAMAYSIDGISTVIDDNCMSKNDVDKLKYVILRENGKLYCQWDDEGSLIF